MLNSWPDSVITSSLLGSKHFNKYCLPKWPASLPGGHLVVSKGPDTSQHLQTNSIQDDTKGVSVVSSSTLKKKKKSVNVSYTVMSNSLQPYGLSSARLLCPWDFPGKNTGVGCHFLLQGIFLTQGSNLCLLHSQADSLPLNLLGNPMQHYLNKNLISPVLGQIQFMKST